MEFFGTRKAAQLAADGLFADVFLANNVLAHVADLRGFVGGIARVLKPDGLAVLEMPYLADLVAHCEFDTIYHQHLCYFSATSLARLFADAGLHLNDVQRIPIHGGSLRVFVGKSPARSPAVKALLQQEQSAGVADGSFLADFRDRIEVVRRELSALLRDLKASGKRIAGYGAAGKATTLLAWCGIDRSLLDYVADLNPYKHGKYMGGGRLPIVAVERIHEDQPDAVLILAWNFAGEIMRQLDDYRRAGGSFIIPIPRPRMAGGNPPQ
jgi:SAM-dependent methyltransferase